MNDRVKFCLDIYTVFFDCLLNFPSSFLKLFLGNQTMVTLGSFCGSSSTLTLSNEASYFVPSELVFV